MNKHTKTRVALALLVLSGWLAAPAWGQQTPAADESERARRRFLDILRNASAAPMPRPPASVASPPSTGVTGFDLVTKQTTSLASTSQSAEASGRVGGRPASFPAGAPVDPGPFAATAPGPISNAQSPPYISVYKLLLRFSAGGTNYWYACSATSVSSYHLLTAAHCIYNDDIRGDGSNAAGWAQEIWVWPGATDQVNPFGEADFPWGVAKAVYLRTYNAWINNADLNWDFGFITLDRRIGDHTGWMGREWDTPTSTISFSGYPVETPYVPSGNLFQYFGSDAGNVLGYSSNRIFLNAFIYGGHSGGPEWRTDGANRFIQGVNSTSTRTGYAEGTRFTGTNNGDLISYIAADDAARPPATRPDLIEYVWDNPSKDLMTNSVSPGGVISVTYNVLNAGFANSGTVTVDFYLSTNTVISTADRYIGSVNFADLPPLNFVVRTANLTVPPGTPAGSYYVGWIMRSAVTEYANGATVIAGYDYNDNSAVIAHRTLTVTGSADLTITKAHSGNFSQGQTGAAYSITVTNTGGTATSGTVTVTDTLPSGLTATSISGTGWTCTQPAGPCSRSDSLAAGTSYQTITLVVNVAVNAPANVTNAAAVSGGGDSNTANNTATDPTIIVGPGGCTFPESAHPYLDNFDFTWTCTLSGAGSLNVTFDSRTSVEVGSDLIYVMDANGVGIAGSPFTGLSLASQTKSVPGSTVRIRLLTNGRTSDWGFKVTNVVAAAGAVPDLTIGKSHAGSFRLGQSGVAYTITVSNIGSAPTSGTVSVTESLPAGFTATALAGTGWNCNQPAGPCTRNDALVPGSSYPVLTLSGNIAANAPSSITNTASVSGGGESNIGNNSAGDSATLLPGLGANITIVNGDPAGVGFNDTTPVSPIGGNTGTTLGQQRLIAFQAAADKWASTLTSSVPIRVRAIWTALTCSSNSAVLGSAGATEVYRDFTNAPVGNRWYAKALANKLAGVDLNPASPDITANFNINLGQPGCLPGIFFYLGLDGNHGSNVDLMTVLEHELGHGLGFQTFTNGQSGSRILGVPSIWDDFLMDNTTNKTWSQMTDSERVASAVNTSRLVWNGANVTAAIPQVLTLQGGTYAGADSAGRAKMYSPNPYQGGSSVSHYDISMSRNQLMEPAINSDLTHEVTPPQDLTFPLFRDIGWAAGVSQSPDLTITKTHVGNFTQGQSGATYTITVTNSGSGASSGTVTVAETVPNGLSAVSMAGTGWNCSQPAGPCTRADSLSPSSVYPPITLTVNVAGNAPSTVTNTATVAGGGDGNTQNNTATDPTIITTPPVPDLRITKTHSGNFTQGQTGAVYTLTVNNSGTGPSSGAVTVTEAVPSGLTATAISGTGWNCTQPSGPCTRSDALASGSNYPVITLTVNVAANAPASVTNSAAVSGGGDSNTGNNTAADPTTIVVPPVCVYPESAHPYPSDFDFTWSCTLAGASSLNVTFDALTSVENGNDFIYVLDGSGVNIAGSPFTGLTLAGQTKNVPGTTVRIRLVTNSRTNDYGFKVTNIVAAGGGAGSADLRVTKTHSGNFVQGQTAAVYSITVSNIGTGPSSGAVSVTDTVPAGLSAASIAGAGWNCTQPGGPCSRTDALAAGSSYPALTLTVNVAANAPSSVVNVAGVSGGGDTNSANNTASDPTTINPAPGCSYPESAHPYSANFDFTWTCTLAGAGSLNVTFDPQTSVESGADWIYIMNGNGVNIAGSPFTGLMLAGQTKNVPGSTVQIRLVTNGRTNDWGFKVTNIVAGGGGSPDLVIAKSHTGNFTQGQIGATYGMTVSNTGGASTSGAVTVTETVPSSLTATSMSGTGWNCTQPSGPCTRSDALAAGSSYPLITLTVNVAVGAPSSVTNTVAVSGGGDSNTANNSASDPTTINAVGVPDLTISKSHSGNFTQGQVGAAYSISVSNSGGATTSGTVTVTESVPSGLTATSISGSGWNCTQPAGPCSRSDALGAGSSYPPITLSVNVSAGAPGSVTNTANVAGGGESNTANNTATDPTTINSAGAPDLTIAKTHSGDFVAGQFGAAYTITVRNAGSGPSAGAVSVTDSIPAGLTATGISGSGWGCTQPAGPCSRSDTLAAAAVYPVLTITVDVASDAPAALVNTATVSGGGDTNSSNNTAADPTTITTRPRR